MKRRGFMEKKTQFKILAIFLFVLCVATGLSIAKKKPLWMDEIHTQFHYIQQESIMGMLAGQTKWEGNNAPLFYILQKWATLVPSARLSQQAMDEAIWADVRAQLILRINAVVFMSLALVFLFYFFCVEFGALTGVYAFLCALASPMVWLYWAEARPYPLIVLLTVFQSVAFIRIWQASGKKTTAWQWLSWAHILLALTSYLAAIQIICAAFVLFFSDYIKRYKALTCSRAGLSFLFKCMMAVKSLYPCGWKKALVVAILPLGITLYYRWHYVKTLYALTFDWRYITENIPLDRLAFYGIGVILLALMFRIRKKASVEDKLIGSFWKFFFLVLVVTGCALSVIMLYSYKGDAVGFHSRFLIFLTPIGIVAQVLLARRIFQLAVHDFWGMLNLIVLTAVLSVIAFCHTTVVVFSYLRYL